MIDSPHTGYMDSIKEVYLKATPGLEEFDNLVKTYFELIKMKKSGLDVSKFLEDTNNQLSSYSDDFYFKSPYFCELLTEIIVEAGERKNEKDRTYK